jgi:hypothetical protein
MKNKIKKKKKTAKLSKAKNIEKFISIELIEKLNENKKFENRKINQYPRIFFIMIFLINPNFQSNTEN